MYRKKEEKNRFTGWRKAFLLAAVLAALSGCGREQAVVLETVPAGEAGEETEDPGSGPGADKETEERAGEGEGGRETGAEDSPATAAPETLQVHVCGAVNAPGVYRLPAGSRVFEAVEAAGGMAPEAAADYLNLADEVFDGAKVRVPFLSELSEGEACGPSGSFGVTGGREEAGPDDGAGGTAAERDGLVDLNHADKETLMSLPGIGEAKAEAILSWREEQGPFEKPEDIMRIPGIKEAAYAKLRDKITVRD